MFATHIFATCLLKSAAYWISAHIFEEVVTQWKIYYDLFNRNKFFFWEHKVITLKQQFLGIILCFFMYLNQPWLLHLFA